MQEKDLTVLKTLISLEEENLAFCKGRFNFNFDVNILTAIKNAVLKGKILKGIYHGKIRKLEPLGVIYSDKGYLCAKEKEKGEEIYTYNLSKFENLEITDEDFTAGKNIFKNYAQEAYGIYRGDIFDVELCFSSLIKEKVINECAAFKNELKENEDGTINLKIKAGGNIEIMRLIFKWGAECKIISPEFLINDYKNYLNEILENYGNN